MFYVVLFSVDIDDCEGNLCENGAKCVDGINSYACQCPAGYTGKHCRHGNGKVYCSFFNLCGEIV